MHAGAMAAGGRWELHKQLDPLSASYTWCSLAVTSDAAFMHALVSPHLLWTTTQPYMQAPLTVNASAGIVVVRRLPRCRPDSRRVACDASTGSEQAMKLVTAGPPLHGYLQQGHVRHVLRWGVLA